MRPISRQCLSFALVGMSLFGCSSSGGVSGDTGGGGSSGTGGTSGGGGGGGPTGNGGATGTGGTGPIGNGCTPAPLDQVGTLAGRFGSVRVTSGGQEYYLQVNQWNTGTNVTVLGTQNMDYG